MAMKLGYSESACTHYAKWLLWIYAVAEVCVATKYIEFRFVLFDF
jgi:hypothetical protein